MATGPSVRCVRHALTGGAVLIALVVANVIHQPLAAMPQTAKPQAATDPLDPFPMPPDMAAAHLLDQTAAEAEAKSARAVRPVSPDCPRDPHFQGHPPSWLH